MERNNYEIYSNVHVNKMKKKQQLKSTWHEKINIYMMYILLHAFM